jgi:hypothetical protein
MLSALSILCWSISLLLPAVDLGTVVAHGWQFLLYGWQGLTSLNIGGLSWLANPLLVAAWLSFFAFRSHSRVALAFAVSALAAGLTSFLFNAFGGAGGGVKIEDFALGFHLWLASALLQTAAVLLGWVEAKRSGQRASGSH